MQDSKDSIYIFGHKKPDPDSICATLAYAALKQALGENHYIPARCGDITPRTQAVLDLFQAEAPIFIETLHQKTSPTLPIHQLSIALVDHNEMSQAVEGAAEANIVEVVDHHRLGTFKTEEAIFFHNEPVGSTCTIIADFFQKCNLVPSPQIAGLLMGGLISDTYLLQSPTTTPKDAAILQWLEGLAGVSGKRVFDTLFQMESSILSQSPEKVIGLDAKIFEEKGIRLSVAQVEEMSFEPFWQKASDLYAALEALRQQERLFAALLLVTDIQRLDSLLLVAGDPTFIGLIDYKRVSDLPIFDLPKIVSRKKEVMPYFSERLAHLNT